MRSPNIENIKKFIFASNSKGKKPFRKREKLTKERLKDGFKAY